MNRIRLDQKILLCIFVLCVVLLPGCATTKGKKIALENLQVDRSTKDEIVERFGSPSGIFLKDSVLTYRIAETSGTYRVVKTDYWSEINYSLVLFFNESGVLAKYELVKVK